jgi:predicted enzyme related to lactoylglutathione lyase
MPVHSPFKETADMPAPAPAPDVRGRFLWYELLTTDPSRATEFYGKAVGWGNTPWPGEAETPYTLLTTGENPIAGMMELPEEARAGGAPPNWLCYVGTPDVDATVTRAKSLGGTVVKDAFEVPEVGRMAILRDPQGAVFAVYKPASDPQPETDPAVGQVSWHELLTTDYEAAFTFYQNLFGWEKTQAMDMGPLGIYQIYGRGGREYGGLFNKTPEMPMPPNWGIYVLVDDVSASIPRIKDAGGQILNGPMDVPGGGVIANCMDPQGAVFSIHSKKAA